MLAPLPPPWHPVPRSEENVPVANAPPAAGDLRPPLRAEQRFIASAVSGPWTAPVAFVHGLALLRRLRCDRRTDRVTTPGPIPRPRTGEPAAAPAAAARRARGRTGLRVGTGDRPTR